MIVFGNKVFNNSLETITAFNSQEVYNALERIDKLRKSKYIVGYIRYETKNVFLGQEISSEKPLIYFEVFENYIDFNMPVIDNYGNSHIKINPTINFNEYEKAILEIKEQIARGNTYQVNYTLNFDVETELSRNELFNFLLRVQKTKYCAYIENDFETILSFSPELFFEIEGNKIKTKPMKGTMKLGQTNGIDNKIILKNDIKNRAENVMIVDLLRNDLGRICETGSIKVPKLFHIETYKTLHQMTSTVTGNLRDNLEMKELFEAIFPCGSITGAPKIETMKIIDSLEIGTRGVYCGAIGYFSPLKTQFSVAIRILQGEKNNKIWKYRVGGGILWDSQPEDEWEECLIKASFLTKQNSVLLFNSN